MGIYKYIKMTFIDDIKKSIFYMIVLIFSIVLTFNIFNIALNEDIISTRSDEYVSISGLGFVIMIVSVMFIVFANSYYMEDKYKEYAVISVSGKTMGDICKIMIIRSFAVTIISVSIGCFVGAAVSPKIMSRIADLLNISINTNVISKNAVITTVLLMFTELECVFLVNAGNMYRSNINELVNREKRTHILDVREIKLSPIVYILVYCMPIIALVMPIPSSDKSSFIKITSIAGLFGVQGIVRYVIPGFIEKYRSENVINNRYKIIGFANLYVSIQRSISLILVMILTIILTITIGSAYENGSLVNTMSLICYGLIVIVMSLTVIYKFLIEGKSRKDDFEQLKLLGYTKKEIKNIIFQEVVLYYFIIMLLVIPYNILIILSSTMVGLMSSVIAFYIISAYVLVFFISGIISYEGYSSIVLYNL